MSGPCESWPVVWCCDVSAYSPEATGRAVAEATEVFWARMGGQFGECSAVLRPCRDECLPMWRSSPYPELTGAGWPSPMLIDGAWYNLGCAGGCDGRCACNTVHSFTLPEGAVRVEQITVDGAVVPTGAYVVYNERMVVRVDGGEWPWCNDPGVVSGPGSWTVTAVFGEPVPQLGQRAVGELACEILKHCPTGDCDDIPQRASRVTRQGVTIDRARLSEMLAGGEIGLYISDLFLSTYNPEALRDRARVYSPDRPPPLRQTWPV